MATGQKHQGLGPVRLTAQPRHTIDNTLTILASVTHVVDQWTVTRESVDPVRTNTIIQAWIAGTFIDIWQDEQAWENVNSTLYMVDL